VTLWASRSLLLPLAYCSATDNRHSQHWLQQEEECANSQRLHYRATQAGAAPAGTTQAGAAPAGTTQAGTAPAQVIRVTKPLTLPVTSPLHTLTYLPPPTAGQPRARAGLPAVPCYAPYGAPAHCRLSRRYH
jgi:hypothetical protein